jgi:hypothetical protein
MTEQSAPKPIVTRAVEATIAGAANVWTFATEAIKTPLVQTIGSLLVAAMLGAGTLAGYQKVTAPLTMPVALPDLPKSLPTPIASVSAVHDVVREHCDAQGAKLDILLERTAPKGSLRKTSGRSK